MPDTWTLDRNCFLARFPVNPAKRERFVALMDELLSFAKPFYDRGCAFAFHGWGRDANERIVIASWDEKVVAELRATPEFQRLNSAMLDCCSGPLIMEQFHGINADRSIFDAYPAGKSFVHQPGKAQEVIFR